MNLESLRGDGTAEGFILALAGGLLIYLIKKFVDGLSKKSDTDDQKFKELTTALNNVTQAITKLEVKLEMAMQKLDIVGELERDVNRIGQKLRDMEDR